MLLLNLYWLLLWQNRCRWWLWLSLLSDLLLLRLLGLFLQSRSFHSCRLIVIFLLFLGSELLWSYLRRRLLLWLLLTLVSQLLVRFSSGDCSIFAVTGLFLVRWTGTIFYFLPGLLSIGLVVLARIIPAFAARWTASLSRVREISVHLENTLTLGLYIYILASLVYVRTR